MPKLPMSVARPMVRDMDNHLASGFLSYARSDDERELGRIKRLADRIMAEFETLTGLNIEIFVDRDRIQWGDSFRNKLEEALQETTFFIPVLTPTYFLRDECRKEMLDFVNGAKALGLNELLLSIRYVDVPDLREDSTDELKAIAAKMEYEDWTSIRLADEDSSQYRVSINKLAQRLVDLTQVLEDRGLVAEKKALTHATPHAPSASSKSEKPQEATTGDLDEEAGLIDLLADLQPAMEEWGNTMTNYSEALEPFTQVMTIAAQDMVAANSAPNSFALKVLRARALALELDDPLQKIEALSKEYSANLMRLDPSVHALISAIETALSDEDVKEKLAAEDALKSLNEMVLGAIEGMDAAASSAESARANQNMSRDLRPIWRRFQDSTRNITDARYIVEKWTAGVNHLLSRPPE